MAVGDREVFIWLGIHSMYAICYAEISFLYKKLFYSKITFFAILKMNKNERKKMN